MKKVIGGEDLINGMMMLSESSPNGYAVLSSEKRDNILLFSPDLIKSVLVDNYNSLSAGLVFLKMRNFFGNGLISSDEPDHKKNRRIMQPSFNKAKIDSYISIIYEESVRSIKKIDGETSLLKLSDNLSFNCVTKSLINKDVPSEYISSYHEISNKIANLPHLTFTDEEKGDFYLLKNFIESLLVNYEKHDNLMWSMINSEMSEAQIIDEVITILGAGFETTSALISWSIINLSNNDEYLAKAKASLPEWVKESRVPTYNEIFSSEIINNIVKETLRTNPPVYFTTRTASKDINIKDLSIKSGSNIFISQYVSHHNKKIYKDPNLWIPERWENNFEKNIPRGAYFPFGIGARKCIGEHFARVIATIFISMFIYHYEFKIIESQVKPKFLVSMIPDGNVTMITKKSMENLSNS